MSDLTQFDELLADTGPAAIAIQQWLRPVGSDIFFPPTYANPTIEKGPPVYNIDHYGREGQTSVCTIDSVQSQANRIEPAFITIANGMLVPQLIVKVKIETDVKEFNLLEAPHRAADALVRFSGLRDELQKAILAWKNGDPLLLARIAPTSIVFGMWDSQGGTGVKLPRLINSVIRAYDCRVIHRSSQYQPVMNYEAAGVVNEKGLGKASKEGLAGAMDIMGLGGIEAFGGIRRDTWLNLCTLRDIKAGSSKETSKLQRYILGLSLIATTYLDGKVLNLRQGCQLVGQKDKQATCNLVEADGSERPFAVSQLAAVEYSTATATEFGVDYRPRVYDLKPNKKPPKN